jgi:hypothetical protein
MQAYGLKYENNELSDYEVRNLILNINPEFGGLKKLLMTLMIF